MSNVLNKKWKEMFPRRILERGLNYFREGMVEDVDYDGDGNISAIVRGSRRYAISVTLDGNTVIDANCSCPYAEDGERCKHEAALLYYIDNEWEEIIGLNELSLAKRPGSKHQLSETEELRQLITGIPDDALKDYLYDICMNYPNIKNDIISRFSAKISSAALQGMIRDIESIRYEYSDASGYVDWKNAPDYYFALSNFVDDKIMPLIDRGLLDEAFRLTCEVFMRFADGDIDDDGCSDFALEECKAAWKLIIEKSSEEKQREYFDWFQKAVRSSMVMDFFQDDLREFALFTFTLPELREQAYALLDSRIDESVNEMRTGQNAWKWGHVLKSNIERRVWLMSATGEAPEEIDEFLERFSFVPSALIIRADRVIERDWKRAVEILKLARNTDDRFAEKKECSDRLIGIYRENKDFENLKNELAYNIESFNQYSIDFAMELKQFLNEEDWEVLLTGLLEMDTCKHIRLDLLKEEGMYLDLLEAIEQEDSPDLLMKYEDCLKENFADECCDLYYGWAEHDVLRSGDRKHYKKLVDYLDSIKRLGRPEMSQDLADFWKIRFGNRTAMKDELRKAGY